MRRIRLAVVFLLLVLILLLSSLLFGVLTYWPSAKAPPTFTPNQGGMVPGGNAWSSCCKAPKLEI